MVNLDARELKERLEEQLGRSLTSTEWQQLRELTERSNVQATAPARRWHWPARDRALCFFALLMALAAVGYAIKADAMLWPLLRIPMCLIAWGFVLVLLRFWLEGFAEPDVSVGTKFLWLFWGLFWGGLFVLPIGIAGGALLFASDSYLTKRRSWAGWENSSVLELLGGGFIIASLVLAYLGRPKKEGA